MGMLIGTLLIVYSLVVLAQEIFLRMNCKCIVQGTVIDFSIDMSRRFGNSNQKVALLYPVFRYTVAGNIYEKKSNFLSCFSKYTLNQDVKVYYNYDNPSMSYVKGNVANIVFSIPIIILGIMLMGG